jgi:hypothetical protein
MSLESRASRAVRSLRASLEGVHPRTAFGSVIHRRRLAAVGAVAFTTLLLAGAVALAAVLPVFDGESASDDRPATTTTIVSPSTTPVTAVAAAETTTTTLADAITPAPVALPPLSPNEISDPLPPATVKPPNTSTTSKPAPTTTTKPAPVNPFTAHQTYGSSAEAPHTEVLWGTGVPGTKVELWSPYGTSHAVVAADGTWEGSLTFVGAPVGSFDFKARDFQGTKIWFTFTITGDGAAPFTANQQSGGSGTTTLDVFWGTGTPGHTVTIWSPNYGHIQATTTIAGDGTWSVNVDYGAVTPNVAFHVKADDTNTGERKYFEYTLIDDNAAPFTANQTYGSCAESPPYDVYYGTGSPGTLVEIISPYGSGSTMIDAEGNWAVLVEFPSAPAGEPFTVKAKDHTGTKILFSFEYTG